MLYCIFAQNSLQWKSELLISVYISVEMEIKKDAVWSGTKTAYGGDIFPDLASVS